MSAAPTIPNIRSAYQDLKERLAGAGEGVEALIDVRDRVIEVFDGFLATWLKDRGNPAVAAATYVSFEYLQAARQRMISAVHSRMMPRIGAPVEQGVAPPEGNGDPLPRLERCVATLEGRAEAYPAALPSVPTLHDDQRLLSRIQGCLQRIANEAGEGLGDGGVREADPRISLLEGRCTALSTQFDGVLPATCERQGEGFFREQFAWVHGVYTQLIGESGSANPCKSDLAWPHFKYIWCLTRLERLSVEAASFTELVSEINTLMQQIREFLPEALFQQATDLGAWFQDSRVPLDQDLTELEGRASRGQATWADRHSLYATIMEAIEAFTAALGQRPDMQSVRYEGGETLGEHLARLTEGVERRFAEIDSKLPPEEDNVVPIEEEDIPMAVPYEEYKEVKKEEPMSSSTWQWPEVDPRIVMTVAGVGIGILALRRLWQKRPIPRVPIVVRPDFVVRPSPFRPIPVVD